MAIQLGLVAILIVGMGSVISSSAIYIAVMFVHMLVVYQGHMIKVYQRVEFLAADICPAVHVAG